MKRILWLLAFLVLAAPVHGADNVAVTPGSGKTMACLDISTFCYSKIIFFDTTGAAFGVTGNPFFVTSTVLGTAANQATIITALGTLNTTVGSAIPAGTNVIGHVIVDTAPTTAVTIASLPSGAVTNVGTFAVQSASTLAAETTKVIGTVNQGTSPWVTNESQINGVTPLMGAGP